MSPDASAWAIPAVRPPARGPAGGGRSLEDPDLLAYWFHVRFGAGPEALGALFFGTSLLSALSFLAPVRAGGLLNTMVFTHLPSNVLPGAPCRRSSRPRPWSPRATVLARDRRARRRLHDGSGPARTRAAAGLTASARALRAARPWFRLDHGRGRDAGAVPAGRRPQIRLRPEPLLPVPLGASRRSAARPTRRRTARADDDDGRRIRAAGSPGRRTPSGPRPRERVRGDAQERRRPSSVGEPPCAGPRGRRRGQRERVRRLATARP